MQVSGLDESLAGRKEFYPADLLVAPTQDLRKINDADEESGMVVEEEEEKEEAGQEAEEESRQQKKPPLKRAAAK